MRCENKTMPVRERDYEKFMKRSWGYAVKYGRVCDRLPKEYEYLISTRSSYTMRKCNIFLVIKFFIVWKILPIFIAYILLARKYNSSRFDRSISVEFRTRIKNVWYILLKNISQLSLGPILNYD